jgi:uncharacterized HhH-GPD family protein
VAELHLAQHAEADRLLSKDPLALLIGMVLDQQVPLEWAFQGPYTLRDRLGRDYDATALAEMEPEELTRLFAARPALHRYPASMAKRVQELARHLVENYDGKAENVWQTATSGVELRRQIEALPGFGAQKARIFVALLGKQLGVRPTGWEEAAGDFGKPGTFMSVADIRDPDTLARVRAYKQAKKAAAKAPAKP